MASLEPPTGGGKRLRKERERAGLSLARLSQISGVSRTYLLKLEKDETSNPSLEVLRRIADALDITLADLLGTPTMQFHFDEVSLSPSLRAFADEAQLSTKEINMLASIKWRKGDEPQTAGRWRFILDSLQVSSKLDEDAK